MSQAVGRQPAFPTTPVNHGYSPAHSGEGTGSGPGVDVRTYLAAKAMQSIVLYRETKETTTYSKEDVAIEAVGYADALLRALHPHLKD